MRKGSKHSEETKQLLRTLRLKRGMPAHIGKILSDRKLGEKNPRSILTTDKVLQIKKLWSTGNYTPTILGAKFGVARQTITDIVKGRTWKHIALEEEYQERKVSSI